MQRKAYFKLHVSLSYFFPCGMKWKLQLYVINHVFKIWLSCCPLTPSWCVFLLHCCSLRWRCNSSWIWFLTAWKITLNDLACSEMWWMPPGVPVAAWGFAPCFLLCSFSRSFYQFNNVSWSLFGYWANEFLFVQLHCLVGWVCCGVWKKNLGGDTAVNLCTSAAQGWHCRHDSYGVTQNV